MKYVFPFLICGLFASCFNEGDCLVTATNYMRIQFKKKKNTAEDTTITFSYYSIEVKEQNAVFKDVTASSQILLPLDVNQASDSTTFIIHRINADSSKYATDTLIVSYSKQAKVISKDCGAHTYYQNLKVEHMSAHHDSVGIKTFSTSLLKNPTGYSTDPTSYALNFQILY